MFRIAIISYTPFVLAEQSVHSRADGDDNLHLQHAMVSPGGSISKQSADTSKHTDTAFGGLVEMGVSPSSGSKSKGRNHHVLAIEAQIAREKKERANAATKDDVVRENCKKMIEVGRSSQAKGKEFREHAAELGDNAQMRKIMLDVAKKQEEGWPVESLEQCITRMKNDPNSYGNVFSNTMDPQEMADMQNKLDAVRLQNAKDLDKAEELEDLNRKNSCFSGDSLVRTIHGSTMKLEHMGVGDYVQTAFGYEPIISKLHSSSTTASDFLKIQHSTGELLVSRSHRLFTSGGYDILAEDVTAGMSLSSFDTSSSPYSTTVLAITSVSVDSIAAPLTPSGTIIVDNIAASTYADVPHWLGQAALAPARWFFSLVGSVFGDIQGTLDDVSTTPRLFSIVNTN